MERHFVQKAMKIATELKSPTSGTVGSEALYLIATMPESERDKPQSLTLQ